jgi:serine/threonine protein kinase
MSSFDSLARQRVSDVISQWRKDHRPDARGFLDQNPEVKAAQSLVVDLAYEEFCLRVEDGEQLDTEKFCGRFPTIQYSLARMLDVHRALNGQALGIATETAWPEPGQRWLDWELIEPLGRGAFSRVFVAQEPALGNRRVALKCSFAGPHEAFVLGSLSHENIVPIHSSRLDEASGLTAISMPLLGRSTLASVLDCLADQGDGVRSAPLIPAIAAGQAPNKGLPSRKRARQYTDAVVVLFAKVARGLAAAHASRIVHGDIKPSNILLTFGGEPMLMDFNLSGSDARQGHIGGTPPYMAPECWRNFLTPSETAQAGEHDPRSDVFSLGAVLLEMLVGRLPFKIDLASPESVPLEDEWQALVRRAASDGYLEPQLRRILDRCLAFDPNHRYQDAGALSDDLSALLDSKRRFKLWSRRLTLGAAACALLGGSFGVWAANYVDPNSRQGKLQRAKALIERQEFGEAARLLGEVQQGHPDPRIAAWTGYCLAMANDCQEARPVLSWATTQLPKHAELLNDLGFCCASLGRDDAETHLSKAIQLDPTLQAARHNRGRLRLNAALIDRKPLPAGTWDDLQRALEVGPPNGRLYLDAATATCYDAKTSITADAEDLIVGALAGGTPPGTFCGSPFSLSDPTIQLLQRRAEQLPHPVPKEAALLLPPPFDLPSE